MNVCSLVRGLWLASGNLRNKTFQRSMWLVYAAEKMIDTLVHINLPLCIV